MGWGSSKIKESDHYNINSNLKMICELLCKHLSFLYPSANSNWYNLLLHGRWFSFHVGGSKIWFDCYVFGNLSKAREHEIFHCSKHTFQK